MLLVSSLPIQCGGPKPIYFSTKRALNVHRTEIIIYKVRNSFSYHMLPNSNTVALLYEFSATQSHDAKMAIWTSNTTL
ncbi:hypothetical protein L208DRAFT_693450 [Tricholoma matsutake]|nr:hypothetical protein L208DRAFT_693450 [Tricholoma matsutake 945]